MQTYQAKKDQADFSTSPLETTGPALEAENSVAVDELGEGTATTQARFPCEGADRYPQGCDGLDEMLDDLHVTAQTAQIPNQDILYEQLAHTFAYGGGDERLLREWGYVIDRDNSAYESDDGFAMVVFRPAPEVVADPAARKELEEMHGRRIVPVVAFRGTDTLGDLFGPDIDPAGVGVTQFCTHSYEIGQALASCGTPDVVGHSLGGALAQLAACRLGGVGRVVTFQSPGIPAEDAARLDEDVESTHYRVEGDVVPTSGEALTDGTVTTFELEGLDTVDAHMDFPLAELAELRGTIPGLEGDGRDAIVDVGSETSEEAAPNEGSEQARRSFGELVRQLPLSALIVLMYPVLALVLVPAQLAPIVHGVALAVYDGVHHDIGLDAEGLHELIETALVEYGVDPQTAHDAASGVADAIVEAASVVIGA